MNIGIDVDGVLADANAATLPLVERYTGTHIEKDEITHWDYVSDTTGLSVWHFVRLMGQAWQDFENMPIEEPTVANSLTQLMRRGHHVSIVTQRTRESFPFVCLWLDLHRIPYDDLIFTSGTFDKLMFPIDILVDDSPRIITRAGHIKDKILLLRDQPWNRNVDSLPPNVERVETLAGAVERILSMPLKGGVSKHPVQ